MLKKVTSAEVCLGMYIHRFEGSWIDHPFWKARFLLQEPRDLQKIQDSAVTAVWIDIAKGRDCQPPAERAMPVAPVTPPEPAVAPARPTPTTFATSAPGTAISCPQEMAQASAVSAHAKQEVARLFQDVRLGQAHLQVMAGQTVVIDQRRQTTVKQGADLRRVDHQRAGPHVRVPLSERPQHQRNLFPVHSTRAL